VEKSIAVADLTDAQWQVRVGHFRRWQRSLRLTSVVRKEIGGFVRPISLQDYSLLQGAT
jgi:hypothetical protein